MPELKILEKEGRPGVAPTIQWVTLRCLPRWGDCATRPGEAHTTCLTAGLTRFPAGAAWGGIRVMGACTDIGGPSLGVCSRKRSCVQRVDRCTVLADNPLSSRAARRASRGNKSKKHRDLRPLSILFLPLTSSPSRSSRLHPSRSFHRGRTSWRSSSGSARGRK